MEIYRRRKFEVVRGICLGDEFTEIDSLECKSRDELNEMYYRFDYNLWKLMRSYVHEYTDYVLIETIHITSPAILCCNEIVLKMARKFPLIIFALTHRVTIKSINYIPTVHIQMIYIMNRPKHSFTS